MTKNELCCNIIKACDCMAELGYEIVLKCNKGYDIDELMEKLAYISSLKQIFDDAISDGERVAKGNEIHFYNEKVLMSKNNSLFLASADECTETVMTEQCCTDLCEIEAKLRSVCINC